MKLANLISANNNSRVIIHIYNQVLSIFSNIFFQKFFYIKIILKMKEHGMKSKI